MNTTNRALIIGIAVVLALGAAAYLFFMNGQAPALAPSAAQDEGNRYQSAVASVEFSYPEGYYLMERSVGSTERPQTAIVLVEDTKENRDVVEGRATEPREGPTAITIDVYPNPNGLSARQWIESDTNWTIRTSEMSDAMVDGKPAAVYTWSGLYEGKSTVVTSGESAYVMSVTWMSPEDALIRDYASVLESVRFLD